MKKKTFFLAALASVILISSCKKEIVPAHIERPVSAGEIIPTNPTLRGVLGTGLNTADVIHLTNNVEWHLSGLVYIEPNDLLIIDPGTTIKGDLSPSPTVSGGGLIIPRGAKIDARGTASAPIVFTSAAVVPASGDWGGVVIIGNAPTNHPLRVRVEGISDNGPVDATFGGMTGTVANDNSGVFQYVRIEYAGFELSPDNSLNGLILAGVGSGTTIDHVESYKAYSDAFDIFGGTVNLSYMIAVDPLDDMFDINNGYTGTISYALGLADTTRCDKTESNGFECDNNTSGTNTILVSQPVINHVTIVGVPNITIASTSNGQPSGTGQYGRAVFMRRNTNFVIQHSLFMGYNKGVSLDGNIGDTPCKFAAGQSLLGNSIMHGYSSAFGVEGPTSCTVTLPAGNLAIANQNSNIVAQLRAPYVRPVTASAANWFPATPASPAQSLGIGAFSFGGADWTAGWSRY